MVRVPPRLLLASALLLLALAAPASVVAADGPAPGEACVPGTVWEDPASGVKYLCIYDEIFGGPRWVLLSAGQRGAAGWPYRSSTDGCLHLSVGLSASSGGGGDAIARTYRWPCTSGYRTAQPTGELRTRIVLQRYSGGTWTTCRDSGYRYNSGAAFGWVAGLDMGSAADCGSGSYRAQGHASFVGAGAWRGGSFVTPYAWLP